jgi:mannose-6-phosphate isomerase-like protein (cupin superfamily)
VESKNISSERRFSSEKMQKVNLFNTERMFADIYCLEPGQEQKRHAHTGADKIYFVIEGTGRFHIGDDERDLGPDQIVLAPADVDHGLRNESQSRLVVLVFMAPNPGSAVSGSAGTGSAGTGSAGILPAPGVAKG